MNELRWDARRGEWVVIAAHRQNRTYHPAECPLCPDALVSRHTERPVDGFDIVVFENRFPPFHSLATKPTPTSERRPAYGRAEVVVFTPEHNGSLGGLPLAHIDALLQAWARRYTALSALDAIEYVFIFENRGDEIGVTLTHPHGQIYGYSFVPPVPARELEVEQAHETATGQCLHCALNEREQSAAQRLVFSTTSVIAYVPFAAHWPYEVHITPIAHRASLLELNEHERWALATGLKEVLQAYDRLFDRPMPYLLSVRQRPTARDARARHLAIELLPALRTGDKLKYRAGSETFMGVFINDVLPEEAAAQLRAVM